MDNVLPSGRLPSPARDKKKVRGQVAPDTLLGQPPFVGPRFSGTMFVQLDARKTFKLMPGGVPARGRAKFVKNVKSPDMAFGVPCGKIVSTLVESTCELRYHRGNTVLHNRQ